MNRMREKEIIRTTKIKENRGRFDRSQPPPVNPTPEEAIDYIMRYHDATNIGHVPNWPEGEAAVAKDPETAYTYAIYLQKAEGEPSDAIFPEGEAAMATDAEIATRYAEITDRRFTAAEPTIARDRSWARTYAHLFDLEYDPKSKTFTDPAAGLEEDAGHSILDVVTPEELKDLRAYVSGEKPAKEFLDSDVFATLHAYYDEDGMIPSAVGDLRHGVIELADWIMRRAISDYAPEILPVEEGGSDRWAEHEWRSELARAKAEFDTGDLSMDDEPKSRKAKAGGVGAYADYMAQRSKGPKRVKEMDIMREGYVKQLRMLLEAEVDQAESLIAARGFSQEIQSMVEKLGRLMNEDLPAVSEQMRNSFGPDVATGFENQTTTVLQSVMDSLRSGKQDIDNSVAEISSGGIPVGTTDMEDPEANDLGLGLDDADLDLDLDLDIEDDEFAGADVAAGPDDEPLGRAKKESVESLKQKIEEARKMIEKAKKLKK